MLLTAKECSRGGRASQRWWGGKMVTDRSMTHAERFIYHVEDAFFELNMCAGMQVVGAPSCAEIHCDSK